MLNIVVNTNYHAAATVALIDNLIPRLKKAGHTVVRNDWENYGQYDIAIFMSPDSDVCAAKSANSLIRCGIMDPKIAGHRRKQEITMADFLVVPSLEHRNALLPFNQHIFVYFSLPDRPYLKKVHRDKEPTIIGYHGNKEHLLCFYPAISNALDRLAADYNIELWAVYNIKKLGRWTHGLPRSAPVRHIQWTEDVYQKELAQCDIGICNNAIPFNESLGRTFAKYFLKRPRLRGYPYSPHDYLIRHKYSTNDGRIYEFSQLSIPVVADYFPSASQVILDGHSGFIVLSEDSWYWALKQLVSSPELRNTMSFNLKHFFDTYRSVDATFERFNTFLNQLIQRR